MQKLKVPDLKELCKVYGIKNYSRLRKAELLELLQNKISSKKRRSVKRRSVKRRSAKRRSAKRRSVKRRSAKRRSVKRVPSRSSRSSRSRQSSLENKPLEFSPLIYKSPDDYYLRIPLPPSSSSREKRGARRLSALAAQRLRKEFPNRRGLTDSLDSLLSKCASPSS